MLSSCTVPLTDSATAAKLAASPIEEMTDPRETAAPSFARFASAIRPNVFIFLGALKENPVTARSLFREISAEISFAESPLTLKICVFS